MLEWARNSSSGIHEIWDMHDRGSLYYLPSPFRGGARGQRGVELNEQFLSSMSINPLTLHGLHPSESDGQRENWMRMPACMRVLLTIWFWGLRESMWYRSAGFATKTRKTELRDEKK